MLAEFTKLVHKRDTSGQRLLLQKWERDFHGHEDPEYFVAAFNYYVRQSEIDALKMTDQPDGSGGLAIAVYGADSTAPVSYITRGTLYDSKLLDKGLEVIDEGIRAFPDRLDMRFGKMHTCTETGRFDLLTSDVAKLLDQGEVNHNQWLWSENEPFEGGEEGVLDVLQQYQTMIYDDGDSTHLVHLRNISEHVLKHYPDHVPSHTNVAIYHIIMQDYDAAIASLHKAEKVDPDDYVVHMNLAYAYRSKGDETKARKYFKKILKCDNQFARQQAQEELDEMKKN